METEVPQHAETSFQLGDMRCTQPRRGEVTVIENETSEGR